MTSTENLIKRIEFVYSSGNWALETAEPNDFGGHTVDYSRMKSFKASGKNLLLDLFGKDHPYYEEFCSATRDSYKMNAEAGLSILTNLQIEVENGWLTSFKGIVSAEIFTDFLEMAEHLLDKGYKDPAAVMIGSVLEEHLRQLCLKNNIPISTEKKGKMVPLNANSLNTDLAKAGVINSFDLKNITAQLDIRNDAAHGDYNKYDKDQVKMMFDYVLNFLSRNPL